MIQSKSHHRGKMAAVWLMSSLLMAGLMGRLVYLMIFRSEHYSQMAEDLHQRERTIKAARGQILDRNGTVIATNRTVCTISVIHNQITDKDQVAETLSRTLGLAEDEVRKKVEKYSAREIVAVNVDKELGDAIRNCHLDGVKVDEDYRRYYPYGSLASKVLGFTGGDNQGIIGLEVVYEEWLKGKNGLILTQADAAGVEIDNAFEDRVEPVAGADLTISLDVNIQTYAQQAALKVMEEKGAKRVSMIVMNPQNGEILAMVNVPEFNLNDPFTLNTEGEDTEMPDEKRQDALNQMWRNGCINDTYEPGSTFKIITASACLEAGAVKLEDQFSCPGYRVVEDRKIRCHKVGGHGAETFIQGIQNSCNPVFIDIGLRLGVDDFYKYFRQFGLMDMTGIDLPGEAGTIMHKKENVGMVELATMSFGQSFQVTPMQMATTVSSLVNGGRRITPHFGVRVLDEKGEEVKRFRYEEKKNIVSKETSATMRMLLESVVSEGSGKNAYIEGYKIGGKTATSQTLPRSANRYISSFIGFAPADNPQVLGMCVIYNPQGVYYGGTIAAPVIKNIFESILPYLGIEKE